MAGSETPNTNKSNPTKRIRWATHRAPGKKGQHKRESILAKLSAHRNTPSKGSRDSAGSNFQGKTPSGQENPGNPKELVEEAQDDGEQSGPARRIYFNIPLPAEERDEEGNPKAHYARNKIRTAKYTPLSFLPKNLYFQFHNVANIYFFFIIILGIFSIFGVVNPGLNAVPLIVILTVTGVKDGIEDWRRTVLDNELNNARVHRLVGFDNVNTMEGSVSLWRRFKKANTRLVISTWRAMKRMRNGSGGKTYTERALDMGRPSIDTRRTSVVSQSSYHSTHSSPGDEGIQMTPVPSPLPGQGPKGDDRISSADGEPMALTTDEVVHVGSAEVKDLPVEIQQRFHGNVINPHKPHSGNARFKNDYWKNVQVGDYVRLYDGEEVPADIAVLSTSDPDGACYIETKNLDGETNLKVRQALHCGRKVKHARHCEQAEFCIESEAPQPNLYSYSALIRWHQHDRRDPDAAGVDMAEPVTINNLLLRGTSLRNTEWVLGVVIFTGGETKIMMNAGITPSKRAFLSRDLNWQVLWNFAILFCMVLTAGIVQGTYWGKEDASLSYFEFGSYGGNRPAVDGFITFWAAVILFQNLVPISLYITLEIIRTCQAWFIYSDVNMYYEKIDYPCVPKSWNISDDLGQIEYVFSDKTGTLTQNVMEFKKCTINGVPYGEAYTEAQMGMSRRMGNDVEAEAAQAREQIARDKARMLEGLRRLNDNPYLHDEDLTFVAADFVDDLSGESGDAQKAANEQFMLALALCHTVITERTPGDPPKIEFKAQSPDEAALVATAKDCGFTVLGRHDDDLIVDVMGEERRYTVLNTLEFNSSRKRMSAIVRMPNGKIILFCKGADSIIYSRLRAGQQASLRQTTAEHLEMFAREGLRTLCIAQRELDETEYQEWNREHDLAAASITNRDENIEQVADTIERELTLLGGTAIEDKLQDGVPDAISLLGQAGIKLWVLTGDKVETAINIGFSCNLLDNDMDLIVFKIDDEDINLAEKQLDENLAVFGLTGTDEELKAASHDHEPPKRTHAVVIDGDSLKLVLDENLKQRFLLLCKQCCAVLCCRVSPAQKAQVVALVKNGFDCLTLSIGDGANDVAMIQEAHVGVGIAGEEGRQAVMSSDYAIAQFRFLTRLLLVHGRWNYRRMAETIANFFYKNLVWTFTLFWYQIYANFDCSYIFDYSYIIFYNTAFTALPVIFLGVLDQDVPYEVSLAVPSLYKRGIARKEWTARKFWGYMGDGLYQSVIVWFFSYLLFEPANFVTSNGLDADDNKRIGVYVASIAVVVANVYVLLNTYRWDWLMLLICLVSVLFIWFWTGIYSSFTSSFTFYGSANQVYGQLTFWSLLLVTTVMSLLPRFIGKAYQKMFKPREVDIIREQMRLGLFDHLLHDQKSDPSAPAVKTSRTSSTSNEFKSGGPHDQECIQGTEGRTVSKHHYTTSNNQDTESTRPMYPPSVAPTNYTHTTRTQRSTNGSDGTDYSGHAIASEHQQNYRKTSFERDRPAARPSFDRGRQSVDRPRPSFDRARQSMDRIRPSFEASSDFTSAAGLMRMESSYSQSSQTPTKSSSRLRMAWGKKASPSERPSAE